MTITLITPMYVSVEGGELKQTDVITGDLDSSSSDTLRIKVSDHCMIRIPIMNIAGIQEDST